MLLEAVEAAAAPPAAVEPAEAEPVAAGAAAVEPAEAEPVAARAQQWCMMCDSECV